MKNLLTTILIFSCVWVYSQEITISGRSSSVYLNIQNATSEKPTITWENPSSANATSTTASYSIKACITSTSEITAVSVYLNGTLTKGASVVVNNNCDNYVNLFVSLVSGSNSVYITATNSAGTTTSETRYITYSSNVVTTTDRKVALVIGNDNYKYATPLTKSGTDATDMAAALRLLGFTVTTVTNCDLQTMETKINTFGSSLSNFDVALFYYSGHGIQVAGNNYIIPIDANMASENEAKYNCVNVNEVLTKMETAKVKTKIIILDACRNNPFEKSWGAKGVTNGGLASIDAPEGTFIGYATSPGTVAFEGKATHSTYTQAILDNISNPGKTIDQIFNLVSASVKTRSSNSQVPWKASSLSADFYFKK